MAKTVRKPKFRPIPEEDRQIGIRMMYLRKMKNLNQAQLADLLQTTRNAIANIEIGRVPLRLNMGWRVCRLFDVHPSWLCVGHWPLEGEQPFPPSDHPNMPRIEQLVGAFGDKSFFEGFAAIGWLLSKDGLALAEFEKKQVLTDVVPKDNISGMQDEMQKLRARLRKATAARNQKAALAKWLGVSLSSVSTWLAGRKAPSGKTTLRLLRWVEQYERQQTKGPVSASTRPEPKTQSKASNEKTTPSPNPK